MLNARNLIVAAAFGVSVLPAAAQSNDESLRSAYVSEMLGNAEGSSISGHDGNGFFLSDGQNFRLNLGGDIQFRYTANFNGDDSSDDYNGGFSLPLARLRFNGLAHGFDFTVVGAFDREDGNAFLEDAFVGYGNEARIQMGQFRLPFLREVNVDERYQMSVERSITSTVFGQGRSQGIQGSYSLGDFRLIGAFSDGFGTDNTDFTDAREADAALTGRVEWTVFGNGSEFSDFTSENNDPSSLMIGAAGHYQDGDMNRFFSYTGDVSFESSGFSIFGSGVGRNIEESNGDDFNDFGLVAQASYRVTNDIEPFARYDIVLPDDDRNIEDDYSFITGGVNYYIAGHAAKFTADVVYAVSETEGLNSLNSFSNTGLLGSTDEGEVAIRVQFQLLF